MLSEGGFLSGTDTMLVKEDVWLCDPGRKQQIDFICLFSVKEKEVCRLFIFSGVAFNRESCKEKYRTEGLVGDKVF